MKREASTSHRPMKDLFQLAEAVAAFYGTSCGEAATARFCRVAKEYRDVVQAEGRVPWFTYVIRLLLTCPVLLERPPGFEWVREDLRWALDNRRFSKEVDRDFWRAVNDVRALFRSGRPGNKARDFFRYEMVQEIMNPVTTAPGQGLIRVKGCSKSEAVEQMAEMEQRWSRRNPDTRNIWRSLQRVEDYLLKIGEQLEKTKRAPGSDGRG